MKNKLRLMGIMGLMAVTLCLAGCVSPATPRDAVPANVISFNPTNGGFNVVNPKSNTISNLDVSFNAKTGDYYVHADSIQDAMDPNVITMSGNAYAQSQKAQADGYSEMMQTAFSGAGALLGTAGGTAVKAAK